MAKQNQRQKKRCAMNNACSMQGGRVVWLGAALPALAGLGVALVLHGRQSNNTAAAAAAAAAALTGSNSMLHSMVWGVLWNRCL
jgi:hypothetical protein